MAIFILVLSIIFFVLLASALIVHTVKKKRLAFDMKSTTVVVKNNNKKAVATSNKPVEAFPSVKDFNVEIKQLLDSYLTGKPHALTTARDLISEREKFIENQLYSEQVSIKLEKIALKKYMQQLSVFFQSPKRPYAIASCFKLRRDPAHNELFLKSWNMLKDAIEGNTLSFFKWTLEHGNTRFYGYECLYNCYANIYERLTPCTRLKGDYIFENISKHYVSYITGVRNIIHYKMLLEDLKTLQEKHKVLLNI